MTSGLLVRRGTDRNHEAPRGGRLLHAGALKAPLFSIKIIG